MRKRSLLLSGFAAVLLMALVVPAWGDGSVTVDPGNPTCADIGSSAEFSFKIDPPKTQTYTGPDGGKFEVTVSGNGRTASVESDRSMSEIIVKGGPAGANIYRYEPAVSSASGLQVPKDGNRSFAISHIEFCYDAGVTLSGVKFDDADFDGSRGAGEDGLEGWTISVYGAGGAGGALASAQTGVDGSYSFTLPLGDYLVCEEARSGWVQTSPDNNECGDIEGVAPGGHSVELTTASSGNNFGNAEADVTLQCGAGPATIWLDPQYELIMRACDGPKFFTFSAGTDEDGNQFVDLKPLPGQQTAQFLERLEFAPRADVAQDSPNLLYDDFVEGVGERPMPYCKKDPRVPAGGFASLELPEGTDPADILPSGHTSCIAYAEFPIVEGGVQARYIIFSNIDGRRTFA